jgi:hypothetical protein
MYLCMYVFMYVCIYVCMYVCIYVCMYLCMYVFMTNVDCCRYEVSGDFWPYGGIKFSVKLIVNKR